MNKDDDEFEDKVISIIKKVNAPPPLGADPFILDGFANASSMSRGPVTAETLSQAAR